MQQAQGSRSGRQTAAGHTPSMARTVSPRRRERPFPLVKLSTIDAYTHTDSWQTLRTGILYAVTSSPCLLHSPQNPSLHFRAPQILRMCLKSTLDFKIYLVWLSTALRRLPPVSSHNFLLLLLVLPVNRYNDPGVAVRTAVHSRGKREWKKNATTAANLFWQPVIGRTSCPTTEIHIAKQQDTRFLFFFNSGWPTTN